MRSITSEQGTSPRRPEGWDAATASQGSLEDASGGRYKFKGPEVGVTGAFERKEETQRDPGAGRGEWAPSAPTGFVRMPSPSWKGVGKQACRLGLSPEVAKSPPVRGVGSFLSQPLEWSFVRQASCLTFHVPPGWKEIRSCSEDTEEGAADGGSHSQPSFHVASPMVRKQGKEFSNSFLPPTPQC